MSGGAYIDVIKKEYRPKFEALRDDRNMRKNPDFFWPSGTQVYCGRQGSGKTIALSKHLYDLKKRYPKAIVVSNLKLNYFVGVRFNSKPELLYRLDKLDPEHQYIYFSTMSQLEIALTNVNNGFKGVIYVIDEIHTYFNSLESKNIPMFVFTEISQQRKQRKLIIGSSQLFTRMAKPFREQCDNLIMCKTMFGFFTKTTAFDGMTMDMDYDGKLSGEVRRKGWFFHTRKLRKSYDTFQKVVSGAEQYEAIQKPQEMKIGRKSIQVKT